VDRNIYEEVHLIEGDITNISSISFVLKKARPDIIFHLAAQSFVPRSFVNPLETLQTNTLGTAYLLEAVRIKDRDAVTIHSGSSEEYGLTFFS
jgi:GDPmannose 4,6-dehydratase